MNYPLRHIELHLAEDHLLIGERLLETGKILGLQEIERHLWEARVDGYEVEIQITPQKVKGCSCDCEEFELNKMCGHVAGMLLAVRKKRSQPKKPPQKRTSQKLTILRILEEVDDQQLRQFVREYARNNRNFSIAFKTRFASDVPMVDQRQKYGQILDAALKAGRNKKGTYSFRGVQKILKVSRELLQQGEQAAALQHYSETLAILRTLVEKLGPVLFKSEHLKEEITEQVQQSFSVLRQMTQEPLAPDLKNEIWAFCLTESQKRVYQRAGMIDAFLQTLIDLADDMDKVKSLKQFLKDQANQQPEGSDFRSTLLIHLLQLLDKQGAMDEFKTLVPNYSADPEFLLFATQHALDRKELERAESLLEIVQPAKGNRTQHKQQLALALAIAQEKGNAKEIFLKGKDFFLLNKELEVIDLLEEHAGRSWKKEANILIGELMKGPYSLKTRDAIAALYAKLEKWTDLSAYIRRIQSLDLLLTYDKILYQSGEINLVSLYEDLLMQYLQNHLGRKPSQKIRGIMAHLHQIGLADLADHLLERFRSEFSERHSLMEELAFF